MLINVKYYLKQLINNFSCDFNPLGELLVVGDVVVVTDWLPFVFHEFSARVVEDLKKNVLGGSRVLRRRPRQVEVIVVGQLTHDRRRVQHVFVHEFLYFSHMSLVNKLPMRQNQAQQLTLRSIRKFS